MTFARIAITGVCALLALSAFATPQEEYQLRNAERDRAAFEALDRNKDGLLTRDEVRGDIDLEARFNDFDRNRDGVIDRAELAQYVSATYGIPQAAR